MTAVQRMALQYVLLFGATGVSLPFAGLWLSAKGLSGAEIGTVLAAPMLARIITGPLLAVWADGFRLRRTPIALMGLVMALGYGLAGLADAFLLRATGWFIGATAMGVLVPLTDVMTLRLAARLGFTFGWPRGAGSAAFVVANVGMGALLLTAPVDGVIVWVVITSVAFTAAAILALPPEPVADGAPVLGRSRLR
jgi:MFS transporter, PPP family, 3-phenylpropionic acid transporter